MRRFLLATVSVFALAFLLAPGARAQYMYLDANGDGVHTVADQLAATGTPTTVDVWIRTNMTKAGTIANCSSGEGTLSIVSYVVNMHATGGTVAYSNFVNQWPQASVILQPFNSNTTDMTVGRGGTVFNPPGDYRLFTVTITKTGGSPVINIVRTSNLQAFDVTSFGSQCFGLDFDNTLKLGTDWFDTDGLGGDTSDTPPVLTAPVAVNGTEGGAITVTASATDPDAGTLLTLSAETFAPFFPPSSSTGPAANPSLTLTGNPDYFAGGNYTVHWIATETSGQGLNTHYFTAVNIANVNRVPVITAPVTIQTTPFNFVAVTGSATDPDGEGVTLSQTNNAPFLSGPSSVGPTANPSITLTGTPNFSQSGSYTINWSAADTNSPAGTRTATTAVTVTNGSRAPVITAPATVSGPEATPISVTGSATDPDGQLVTLSQTNNTAFLAGPASAGPSLNPSITLSGTPNFAQAGSYTINWSAVDNGSPASTGTATTSVIIGGPHRNPVITVPASVTGTEGSPMSITATAASPDGLNVTLCANSKPAFLTGGPCTPPSLNPTLTLSGTPGPNDAGSYTVQWSATDSFGGVASATSGVTIVNSGEGVPVLNQPSNMTVDEGQNATQQLTASDPNNDPLVFSKVGTTPFFMVVSQSGLVTLAPGFTDAGNYTGTVRVSDGTTFDQKSFGIVVVNVNRCPIANAGGPYTGVRGITVTFNGTGSSDPDGTAINYSWDFGDGSTGFGGFVSHIYTAAGTYGVVLSVSDGTCSGVGTTTATISADFPAYAFTTGANGTVSLGAGKPYNCVQVQPFGNSFQISNVNMSSFRMVSPGTGVISFISAVFDKTTAGGDRNGDGIAEIQACFAKMDLRRLFQNLPPGRNEVDVSITAQLITGGTVLAPLHLVVKSTGGNLAASISPNPLNPRAKLSFATSKPGAVRVQMFDLSGRLVRKIADEATIAAGYHDFTIDGRDASGGRLASGIYFVRIWTENDGSLIKNLTVLK